MIKLVEDLEKKLAGIADEVRAVSERAQQTLAKVREVQQELEQVRKRLYATAQTAILPTPKIPE
jgi:hypothetical protein